jgi:four helix bundle protein
LRVAGWKKKEREENVAKIETFEDLDGYRAARSMIANMAEGFVCHHPQENLPCCRQARGSHAEVLEHVNWALDEKLTTQSAYDALREEWTTVKGLLGGYLAYLEKIAPNDKRFRP